MNWVSLPALPIDHPLRNRPLAEIGARYSNKHGLGTWTTVKRSFGIARTAFNDLSSTWRDNNLWQAPLAPQVQPPQTP